MSDSAEHIETRPRPGSVTVIVPRWVLRVVIIIQATIDIVFAVIVFLYLNNVTAQRTYTKGQIDGLRSSICTLLDYTPPGPPLFQARHILKCKAAYQRRHFGQQHTSAPTPGALSGPLSTSPVQTPAPTPAGPPAAGSRTALASVVTSGPARSMPARPSASYRSTSAPQPPTTSAIVTNPLPSPTPILSVVCSAVARVPVLPPVC